MGDNRKIPKGWKKVKLGEVAEINPSVSLKKGTKAKKVPMEALKPFNKKVQFFSIDKYKGGVKFINGDTLVARITPSLENGKTAFIDFLEDNEIGFGSTEFIVLRAKNEVTDKQYIYYLAISPDFRDTAIKSMTGSSGRQRVQTPVIKEYEFFLPPLPEQKTIASVLSSLDDKIELLYRQNKTLESMAEALFRKWFIEDAKEDWEEVPLEEIYTFEKGFEPGSKNYLSMPGDNNIRFIRVGDMLSPTGSVFIEKGLTLKTCNEEDLLMSFDGTVGRVTFGLKGAYSSGIRRIYSKNPLYNSLGLKFTLFTYKDIQDIIRAHASGTVILHASSSIKHLTFSFPPEEQIIKFNDIINPLFNKILSNKRQIRTLEKLRDTLLPKLMSGEIRVKF